MQLKIPKKKSKTEIIKFFKKIGLASLTLLERKPLKVNTLVDKKAFSPELIDLYRLYSFITLNKRTTVLEFGSGWSSLVLFYALCELKSKFSEEIKNLRRNNPFELFIIDNEKKFLNISRKRIEIYSKKIKKKNSIKVNYNFSDVYMTEFNGRIATSYKKLPRCNPDFIYLDGPDQFKVKKSVQGVSTRHKDMMPMVCDLIKFEYFFTPGTIILTDGRGANAKFLKDQFKRKWKYIHDKTHDQHIFHLIDDPIGKYNQRQINFYQK